MVEYIYWHYGVASIGILSLLRNYLIGTWHKFLISTHFKNLLAPWHRANPSDVGKSQNIGDHIINAVIDFYIRIVAALVRLTIILTGLLVELLIIFAFLTLFVVWLLWPVILVYLVVQGLGLVLSGSL